MLIAVVLGSAGLVSVAGPVRATGPAPAVAGPAPAPPAGTEGAASAQAKATGKPVVVDSLTSATELVTAEPDGSISRTISAEPVRMLSNGAWADIDTTLVDNGTAVRPKMLPVGISFGRGGSTALNTTDDGNGHSVSESWPYGTLPAPVLSGNQATYPEVLPGVDLVQVAGTRRMSLVLKVKTAQALADPRVQSPKVLLQAGGASIAEDGTGGLTAKDPADGRTALAAQKGQWWDSRYPDTSAADPGGPGLARSFALKLSTDSQGLSASGAIGATGSGLSFPVYVDPDWSTAQADWTYVDSAFPNTSYINGQFGVDRVNVGFLPAAWDYTYGLNHTTRGYWDFSTASLRGKNILAAHLNVTDVWSSSCTATTVHAKLVGPIGPGTTWNAQPAWGRDLDAQTFAYGNSASCPANTVGFNVAATADLMTANDSMTFGLVADNDTWDQLSWKRFDHNASLTVHYDSAPNTPQVTGMTGCYAQCPTNTASSTWVTRYTVPSFSVLATDPDGTVGGSLSVWMTVRDSTGNVIWNTNSPVTVTSGGTASWNGSPGLNPRGSYTLAVQVSDSDWLTSPVVTHAFTVDTTAPPPPATPTPASGFDTNHNDSSGVPGQTAYTFTLTAGDAKGVQGFIYSVAATTGSTPTYSATATCGDRQGPFVVVCPSDHMSTTITVAAVDASTTLTVWAFDEAGNVSSQVRSQQPVSYTFTVGSTTKIPSTVSPVTTTGTAVWQTIKVTGGTPAANSCTGTVTPDPLAGDYAHALELVNGGDRATTATGAVDTSQSFSTSAWFCPKSTATVQDVLTQLAANGTNGGPAASLGIGGSPNTTAPVAVFIGWIDNLTNDYVPSDTAITAGQWSFVSAVYDKINRQMRLTVTTSGFTGTWVTAASAASHIVSPSTAQLVIGDQGMAGRSQFLGQVLHPLMVQGVLTSQQFATAGSVFDFNAGTDEGVLK